MPRHIISTSQSTLRAVRAVMLLAMLCALGGCAGGGAGGGPANSFAAATGGATVAFESIDGPPPQVFDRMVGVLDSEAKLRNIAVVSREGSAAYRVRSYLSAQIRGGRTIIAWVWDVYDRDQQRALRLAGEEATGKPGRDAWAQADDLVLRRIAQAGLTGLGGMINGTSPQEPQPAPRIPGLRGPAVASADEIPATAGAFAATTASFTAR
ncbi:MAG TPA: hypothetical protein VES39_10035 [Rhodospirillales bacterium]|nr:hypothetical protein [Rhodospirillales bacterium]